MHQYLFFIGQFPIRAYGLILAMAIFFAGLVAYYITKKDGRGWHVHMPDFMITIGVAGLIGARLWDVFFFDWSYYHNHLLEIPFVWQGGMAIQGGVLAGTLAGFWYCKKHNIEFLALADLIAPAAILGQSIGRMANLMNGDAFGHPTGGDFGIIYPHTTLAYKTYGAQPLWPAEIWEGQIDILIFVILLFLSTQKHKKGQIFCIYVGLYSLSRFFLEFLRGDYITPTLGLHSAQVTSLIVILCAIAAWIYLQIKGQDNLSPTDLNDEGQLIALEEVAPRSKNQKSSKIRTK